MSKQKRYMYHKIDFQSKRLCHVLFHRITLLGCIYDEYIYLGFCVSYGFHSSKTQQGAESSVANLKCTINIIKKWKTL